MSSKAHRPDILLGDEGETVFIPASLAETLALAREHALRAGISTDGMDCEKVWMLPIPEHFVVEETWWCVYEGTPDAVPFWRFRL